LFDAAVILLQTVIKILIGPMLDLVTHDLADSPWIGTVPICCDRLWRMTDRCNRLLEKSRSLHPYSAFRSNRESTTLPSWSMARDK
jgi:hypothetical protein